MSAQRVLGTEQALHAAQQLHSMLSGSVRVHLNQVANSGRALSDPALWDGPEAVRFRQDWPQVEAVIKQFEPNLERLQVQAQTVVQNILRAGGDGTALQPQTPPAHHDGGGGGGILGFVHIGLAVASFIPVVGTGASLVDAGIYAAQGDYVDAGISALGAVPVVGEAADVVKAARVVDDGVKLARAGEEGAQLARAGEEGAQLVKTGDELAQGEKNLYRFDANNPKWNHPDGPPDVIPNKDIRVPKSGIVSGQDPAAGPVQGASVFDDPMQAPASGTYWQVPHDTPLPEGLGRVRDGADVGGPMPAGHSTIYPTRDMPYEEFNGKVRSLPWQYGGVKPPPGGP